MTLHLNTATLHGQNHLGAQVLIVISRRNRKISLAETRTIPEVVPFPSGVPATFLGIDVVEPILRSLIESDIVKDEKLSFRAEQSLIGNACRGEVLLRLVCDISRVAVVGLFRD